MNPAVETGVMEMSPVCSTLPWMHRKKMKLKESASTHML